MVDTAHRISSVLSHDTNSTAVSRGFLYSSSGYESSKVAAVSITLYGGLGVLTSTQLQL